MANLLENLKVPPGARKKTKRLGRGVGSGHGKTSCRGENGFGHRSGSKALAGFEGGQMPLHRRLPKRGFKNPFRKQYTVINISDLERWGLAEVGPDDLVSRGLLGGIAGSGLKLLGKGEPTRAYKVTVHKVSGQAAEKIKKAGGAVSVIEQKKEQDETGSQPEA